MDRNGRKRSSLILIAAAAALLLLLSGHAFGHGGQYRGPGEFQPPNTGDQGSNGTSGTASGPAGPQGPSVASPGGSQGMRTNRRGGAGGLQRKRWSASQGFERWEFWWEYNKDTYLNLKQKLFGDDKVKGTASFFVGRRPKGSYRTSMRATPEIVKKSILPYLESALALDHPDVLDSSVLAIARVTEVDDAPLVIEKIRSQLSSKHKSVRQSACLSLGVLGSPAAIQTCFDLMTDSLEGRKLVARSEVPKMVRAFAALSLGLIGSGETWEKLRLVIEREDPKTQKDLIACAITALGLMGETEKKDEIVDFLTLLLETTKMDSFLRANIPVALGKLGDSSALSTLVRLFEEKDQNEWIRQSCVIAFGQLADFGSNERVVKNLMAYAAKGKEVQARHLSFIALAEIAARDPNFKENWKRHAELASFFIKEIMKPTRPSHGSWASLAAALHAMPHDTLQWQVVQTVRDKFMDTKNPSHKAAYAIALGLLNAQGTGGMLHRELDSTRDKALQGYLCVGLGLMKWTGAADRIRVFASSETVVFLRLQAAVALGLMGDPKAVDVLVEALQNGQTLHIVSSAARALGQIADVSAVEPLAAIVADENGEDQSKAFAVVALGIIGEKTDLPWNASISRNCNYFATGSALREVLDIL